MRKKGIKDISIEKARTAYWLEKQGKDRQSIAKILGITKGRVSQLLNGFQEYMETPLDNEKEID